jgi:hypothetical protein
MENQQNSGILAQAKEFVAETFEAAKEAFGIANEHPQAKVEHQQPFLNDIAKGNIEPLHHVTPVEPTLDKALGKDASKIKIKKFNKEPLLNEIKEGVPLSHVETKDKAKPLIEKDVKIKEIGKQRETLLNEVEEFDKDSLKDVETKDKSAPRVDAKLNIVPPPSTLEKTKEYVAEQYANVKKNVDTQVEHTKEVVSEKLHDAKEAMLPKVEQTKEYVSEKLQEAKETVGPKVEETKKFVAEKVQDAKEATGLAPEHPQSKVQHDQPFLNDIAKGNIEPLHHVTPVEKDLTATLGEDPSKIHIKKIDRKPLLNEIKEGVPLTSVETEDKSKPVIEEGVTIKNIGKDREKLLDEVTEFEKDTKLKHVETDDKSAPLLSGRQ